MDVVEFKADVKRQQIVAGEGVVNQDAGTEELAISQALRHRDLQNLTLESCIEGAVRAQNAGDLIGALELWQQVRQNFPENAQGYSGCGTVLRELRRLDDAETVLDEAIKRFPNDEKIAIAYAWVPHYRSDWTVALKRWEAVINLFPGSFDGYFGGGAVLKVLRRFDEADKLYRQAFGRFPISPGLLADFAAVAQARGDLAEASRRWGALHTIFPNRLEVFLRESRALRDAGLHGEAAQVAADALKKFPRSAAALINAAQIAQQRSRWTEALQRWDAFITEFPGEPDGYLGAANALNQLSRFADAQNVLQPALRIFPNSADIVSTSAWTEHYRGRHLEALKRWENFRARFPNQTAGYVGGAAALLSTGKVAEATELLEHATHVFPQDPHIAMQWARIPQQIQKSAESSERWGLVFGRFPDNPAVRSGYALSLAKAGNSGEADRILEDAIGTSTHAVELFQAYAECANERRDWPVAETRWRKFVEIFPERVSAWTGLSETLRNAGRLEESKVLLTEALKRFPDDIELERHLAITVSSQRDWRVALPLWEKLKRRSPRNPGVRSGITQALWQAQQDFGVVSAGDSEGSIPFEIPPLLLEVDDADDDSEAVRSLLMKFESIGDTCEFGIVQRRFGAEPISLLRWASTPPANLVSLLDTKFEGVGEPENTVIDVIHGEYTTRDRRYHMFSHTFTPETAEPIEKFTAQHLRRMTYLRRKLIEDLTAGEKVFVYKCNQGLSDDEAKAIFHAIRRYGDRGTLLCVRLEDDAHSRGTLVPLEDGLFVGYIDRFSTIDINVDVWVELCKKTEAAWQSTRTTQKSPDSQNETLPLTHV